MSHNYNVRNAKYATATRGTVDVTIDHPEYGAIPFTLVYGKANDEISEIVLEALDSLTIADYEEPVVPQEKLDQMEVANAKRYLAETDWVVTKIAEKQILGEDVTTLVTKYRSIIDEREAKRARLNEIDG